jgi:hypothetical protein
VSSESKRVVVLRHNGRVRRVEGEKREAESCWKSERVFILGRGVGVADEAGSDTIPNAAGGEGGHGVAKTRSRNSQVPGFTRSSSVDSIPKMRTMP